MFLPSYISTKTWQLFIPICLKSGTAKLTIRKPITKNEQGKQNIQTKKNKKHNSQLKLSLLSNIFFLGLPIAVHVKKTSTESDVRFKLVLGRFNNDLEITILHSLSSFRQRHKNSQTESFSFGPLLVATENKSTWFSMTPV